jgi:hypothetical protein
MNNYQKIATIVLRCLACYLLLFVLIEWAEIAGGTLLINFGIFPHGSMNFEVRLLMSVVYLIAGLALYVRSNALAHRIAGAFQDDE